MSSQPTLIVLSHLRWAFVFQRPQHLMTRFAEHYRIFFVEEPQHTDGPASMDMEQVAPGITVCIPRTSNPAPGFHDDQVPVMKNLLEEMVRDESIVDPVVWLYTPMALPLVDSLPSGALIYDCMDELSAFQHAPRQLLQRESALLRRADLVFTGGVSLYEAKRDRHSAVHCMPSSVDAAHFGRARNVLADHPLQSHIPHPRLGFFGVIDERMDVELIGAMARARPDWQLVLVGPIVKIDAAILPRLANVHFLGQQSYEDLPEFLAGWDVCLLPFALNESTRFISPTKTLEYMAAAKPIVSTAIRDVVTSHGDTVAIGRDTAGFIAACDAALAMTPHDHAKSAKAMAATIAETSWANTADRMLRLIEAIPSFPPARGAAFRDPVNSSGLQLAATQAHGEVVIIGGGPTGLSAAYHLGEQSVLLEQHDEVGGWCRSIVDNGFTFDYAGHIMFSKDPYVHQMYEMLLGDNVHWQDREAWIYSSEVYTRYPFQGALYGLPPAVLKDCLIGAIEARFGKLKAPAVAGAEPRATKRSSSASACKAESITDCCADGVIDSLPANTGFPISVPAAASPPANFEQFIHEVWGSGVAKHFALPYNRKLWGVPLTEMETSWLGGRVPLPDLEEMISGALQPVPPPMGPNARFGYPLKGGFQALMDGFLPHLRGEVRCGTRVKALNTRKHELRLEDGTRMTYEQLISTMPLPQLIRMIGADAPPAVQAAASNLRHVSVRCVNLGVGRSQITNKHWIYYPGDSVFHRIFVQGNASPDCNAPGGFGLTCEITYSPLKPLPCEGEALIDLCIADCIRVGIIDAADPILARNEVDMPYAYVIYDHARAGNVQLIRNWLLQHDIHLAGRYSEWEYYNSDHAFLAGRAVAANVAHVRAGAESAVNTATV